MINWRKRVWGIAVVGAGLLLIVLVWVGVWWLKGSSSEPVPTASVQTAGAAKEISKDINQIPPIEDTKVDIERYSPLLVQLAAISPWYADADANAPPREKPVFPEPTMEGDTMPPEPLAYARSLGGSSPALLAWLAQWEADIKQGRQPTPDQTVELTRLLADTQLTCVQLQRLGFGVAFISEVDPPPNGFTTDPLAIPFYKAAVTRAEQELAGLPPDDERGKATVHALQRMRALWGAYEYPTLERLYTLITEHSPTDSKAARRAAYLRAEAIHLQGRHADAISACDSVRDLNERIADVSDLDRAEVNWLAGLILFSAQRYPEAISRLQPLANDTHFYNAYRAQAMIVACLAELGRAAEARKSFEEYVSRFHPNPSQVADLEVCVRSAEMAASASTP